MNKDHLADALMWLRAMKEKLSDGLHLDVWDVERVEWEIKHAQQKLVPTYREVDVPSASD